MGLLVLMLWWTGSARALIQADWAGPEEGGDGLYYTLTLSDYTGVLAVSAEVLISEGIDQAVVASAAQAAGFLLVSNAVDDTLKIALARASDTPYQGETVRITLPAEGGGGEVRLLQVLLNDGALPVSMPGSQGEGPVQFRLTLSAGWSLISLPLSGEDRDLKTLFPDALSAFAFEAESGYRQVSVLDTCRGYWLKLETGGEYLLTGSHAVSACDLSLAPRWSLIGAPAGGCAVERLGQEPEDNLRSVFGYQQGYQAVQTLVEGQGYWVDLTTAGRLLLTSP